MRDNFQTTITYVVNGTLVPAAGVEITVYPVGTTTNPSTIYQRREGAAQGNALEAGTLGGPNPFTTGPTGAVEFWVPPGVYDVHVRDTSTPERVQRRGAGGSSAPLQFNSMPAAAGSLPSTLIAGDGGLALPSLGADVLRQAVPIGGVIDWYRPSAAVPVPTGFEISDGKVMAAGTHDFPVAGAINLPDLRNAFILGADPFKSDGSGATPGNGTAAAGAQHPNAPGIRGSAGSMLTTLGIPNLPNHGHTLTDPGHAHSVYDPGHLHDLAMNFGASGSGDGRTVYRGNNAAANYLSSAINPAATNIGIYGSGTGISIANTGSGTSFPTIPVYYGLLKIMKVKRG